MKITNFKMYPLMIAVSAFLTLSGCDGTTGIISDSGIGTETPTPPIIVPDAGTSTVTASPLTVLADGTETATVTVTVNDTSSNPITDATVELTQTGSSMISAVTNVGDGTYTFTVTSDRIETVTYTAKADGVTITDTAAVTFRAQTEAECLLAAGGYEAIVINGRTWLDRNLGAGEVAADTNDPAAYGDLYQWGRSAEGHQVRDPLSDFNDTLATTVDNIANTPWEGKFILTDRANGDWVEPTVDVNGITRSQSWSNPYDATTNPNQVCPCGYIVPTEQDFIDMNDMAKFKLVYAGYRGYNDAKVWEDGVAYFWTNAAEGSVSVALRYRPGLGLNRATGYRGYGMSIRCIKP